MQNKLKTIQFNTDALPYKDTLIQKIITIGIIIFIGTIVLKGQTIMLNIIDRMLVPYTVYQIADFGSMIILMILGLIILFKGRPLIWEFTIGVLTGTIIYVVQLLTATIKSNKKPAKQKHEEPVSKREAFLSQTYTPNENKPKVKTMNDVFGK